MSRNRNKEKYRRTQRHEHGSRAELFEYEKHFGDEKKGGGFGIFQSLGMKFTFPKDDKKDAMNDFMVQDTTTGNREGRSRQSTKKSYRRNNRKHESKKYEKPSVDKEHQYVLPLNNYKDGMEEYSGVIEDVKTGEKQCVRGFTSGPQYHITGNDPEEMKTFATMLQNL